MKEKIKKPTQVPDGLGNLAERIKFGINFANQKQEAVVLEFNEHHLTITPGSEIEEAFGKWDEMIKREEIERKMRESQTEEGFGTISIEL